MGLLLSCRFKMSSIMKWPVIFWVHAHFAGSSWMWLHIHQEEPPRFALIQHRSTNKHLLLSCAVVTFAKNCPCGGCPSAWIYNFGQLLSWAFGWVHHSSDEDVTQSYRLLCGPPSLVSGHDFVREWGGTRSSSYCVSHQVNHLFLMSNFEKNTVK
jgi:hypothetical protein